MGGRVPAQHTTRPHSHRHVQTRHHAPTITHNALDTCQKGGFLSLTSGCSVHAVRFAVRCPVLIEGVLTVGRGVETLKRRGVQYMGQFRWVQH